MYKLHYFPSNASFTPHMLLRELGVAFELVLVDRDNGAHHSPEYLALNPNGLIPTLVDGDLVLFETAAIVLHLCDRHPDAGFAPPFGSVERSHFYKWLIFLTNTVQSNLISWFYPERFSTDPNDVEKVKQASALRLAKNYTLLDNALRENGPYLLGERLSAADHFLYMLTRWGRFQPKPARDYPALRRHAELLLTRPAVKATVEFEKLSELY